MKAIEVLFNEINELNDKLKFETQICNKAKIACKIKEVSNLICQIAHIANWAPQDEEYI